MWIQVKEAHREDFHTSSLRHPEHTNGERVEFTDSYRAQVSEDVADALLAAYDIFEPSDSSGDSTDEDE